MSQTEVPHRKLRVAVLNRIFQSTGGGAERYSIALVEQLAMRHEIHVFAQDIAHCHPDVQYHRISRPLRRPRWVNQLWFAAATWWHTRRGFDVVHSHENTWHGNVQTVHVLPVWHNVFLGRSGLALAWRWLKVATSPRLLTYLTLEKMRYRVQDGRKIVLPSESLRGVMTKTFPSTTTSLCVLTPGVPEVCDATTAATKINARRTLGLPVEGHCVLFVGNDFRKKGLPTLLKALADLPAETHLAVVGNLAQKRYVEAEIQRLDIGSRVFFLGALESVQIAYLAANCLAHPTLEDTFAMVVLEAMACSLPVVVSNGHYCGIAQLLKNDENALLLQNPRDSNELASKLRCALFDTQVHTSLSLASREFASQHLWSVKAQSLLGVYDQVVVAN